MTLFPAFPIEDYRAHEAGIREALARVLEGGHYILGPEVEAFEREFAAFVGVAHAVGVANGTDAIELILLAAGIGPGDRVAVPSHTAVASVSAIKRAGAEPVFVDVDARTRTLSPEALEEALESPVGGAIKAVLAVHLYGHPCDMRRLEVLCASRGIDLIEDCAQAHGAVYRGGKAGGLARAAAFSFYPTKNLGAIGDGGAVTTNDPDFARRIRVLRQYGWERRYISECYGVNSRLDEMQAAILRVKLRSLDTQLMRRRELAARYERALADVPGVEVPMTGAGCEHAWHLYVIRCAKRDALMAHLVAGEVPVALHYPAAVHEQPAYRRQAMESPPLPETEALTREILTLPLHPYLDNAAVDHVVERIRAFQA
jgi:dTDP-4-amino-4,6-dideoxygalactose transaminase